MSPSPCQGSLFWVGWVFITLGGSLQLSFLPFPFCLFKGLKSARAFSGLESSQVFLVHTALCMHMLFTFPKICWNFKMFPPWMNTSFPSFSVFSLLVNGLLTPVGTTDSDSYDVNHFLLIVFDKALGIRLFTPSKSRSNKDKHWEWSFSRELPGRSSSYSFLEIRLGGRGRSRSFKPILLLQWLLITGFHSSVICKAVGFSRLEEFEKEQD